MASPGFFRKTPLDPGQVPASLLAARLQTRALETLERPPAVSKKAAVSIVSSPFPGGFPGLTGHPLTDSYQP